MLNTEWRELTLEDTNHITDKEPEKFWYTVSKEKCGNRRQRVKRKISVAIYKGNTRLCLQCNRGVEETVEHLVLECSKYEQERESLMDVVHEQCAENEWNARCVEEDSGMRYLVGLDEECNMTVVDAMKDFLVYAWNKRQGC
ncbi:hypothetical protein FHG87_002719 [Trinorchestia longiramus]|nr:hypothetical protein FHG87_002719 [Trinorchestia longiramus]